MIQVHVYERCPAEPEAKKALTEQVWVAFCMAFSTAVCEREVELIERWEKTNKDTVGHFDSHRSEDTLILVCKGFGPKGLRF